jgi:ferredoxin
MCESIAADIFEINDDDELEVKTAVVPDSRLGEVQRAVACCPNAALSLTP